MTEKVEKKVPGPHILEKWGTNYFRKLSSKVGEIDADDEVHILNSEERKRLRSIERWAIFRAAMAGAISAIVSGGASFLAYDLQVGDDDMVKTLEYWAIVGGVTGIATVFEIGFLYWDALRTVHKLSVAAGLDLISKEDEEASVLNALVRAALELPNPSDKDMYINPNKEASGLMVIASTLVYKAKVTVTNFLFKALARRALGRVVARAYMEFVAVPVTAGWNAVVCWWVIREARIRAMGPSAAKEMVHLVLGDNLADMSPEAKLVVRQAVGSSIVRTVDLHPNLHSLVLRVREKVGSDDSEVDNSSLFLKSLKELSFPEQKIALKILGIAMVIDGKIARKEKKLWEEANSVCHLKADIVPVKRLMKDFRHGNPITKAEIDALIGNKTLPHSLPNLAV